MAAAEASVRKGRGVAAFSLGETRLAHVNGGQYTGRNSDSLPV